MVVALAIAAAAAACAPRAAHANGTCYADSCASCSPGGGNGHRSTLIPSSAFPPEADGNTPIVFVDPNDGSARRFVVTQQGRIWVWQGWKILPTPFLDITSRVNFSGERGLLAMAVAPNYATSGQFFVYYIGEGSAPGSDGDIVIERYQRSSEDPNVADPTPTTVMVIDHHFAPNHNGGWLAFGPNDGYLYISTGDGGGGCDNSEPGTPHAQNLGYLLGKVLRIDVNGSAGVECGNDRVASTAYGVPASNPFVAAADGRCDEIWAYGVRNPFRFSFDRQTGDLWLGDVGQDSWEESDYQAAGVVTAYNFGWVLREGCQSSAVAPSGCSGGESVMAESCQYPTSASLYDPVLCHSNPNGWASIMGGYRYRGTHLTADLAGRYIYSDAACGQIWRTTSFSAANPAATQAECWQSGNGGVYGFGEDHLGELYVVNGSAGRIDCLTTGTGGCPWASDPLIFGDDLETGNANRWSGHT